MPIPDANNPYPMAGYPQVCFIKNIVKNPQISIGDYTYYDDPEGAENFEKNVLYHYPFIGDQLVIGKFCAIARGVKFIMNGANHAMSGISTYPFGIFGQDWAKVLPHAMNTPHKGDTVIGHDVWLGYDSLLMPGVHIGNGAIIASRSVITKDVPAYSIVGGNPAQVLKTRFDSFTIQRLQALAWWDWSIEKITQHLELIMGGDVDALERV
ncbi:Vat family streptogramin A O-acetyltransferase [Thiolinea disciformis]|uniref:Vat family streptogramin A O-acetyltransferase n=1 Tax=Thiolinea disciformis TaxID=125614 RepID=UPI00037C24B6|nr:Vat family streptogramin A O-acetyltransferase [Thiolinea disciformis]